MQKTRQIIIERKEDIEYFYRIKNDNDFIFTTDLDLNAKITLCRESFTKSINKALQFVGKDLDPPKNLSSQSFKKWDD